MTLSLMLDISNSIIIAIVIIIIIGQIINTMCWLQFF